MDLNAELSQLLQDQWGLATRRQLLHGGVSAEALRWALSRHWSVVLPGIVAVHRAGLTVSQRQLAALLYAGPTAVLTGSSAAHWHGLSRTVPDDLVEVLVAAPRETRRVQWLQIRATSVPPGFRPSGPLRFVGIDRCVVDAARASTCQEDATAIVIEAVQRGKTTLDRLASTNATLGRRGSALASRALIEAASGAWSIPEVQLVRLVGSSRVLPQMWCNPLVRGPDGRPLTTPDGWFDDVGLAVMVHSRQFHDGARWDATLRGDADLVAHGVTVVPVTPSSLAHQPRQTLDRIEGAYRAAQLRPRPAVRSTRRSPWAVAAGRTPA